MVELWRRRARARARAAVTASALAAATSLASAEAAAQVHWDASAQVGAMKRTLSSRAPGVDHPAIGPAGKLTAHLALFPLVRVGAYVGHDISPLEGSARDLTWFGARTKLMSPWPRGALRAWLFAGFGYTAVYARSHHVTRPMGEASFVGGAGGGFFEVPFGLGVSYKLRRPWTLCAELGGRAGFGHAGSAYDGVDASGLDTLAIGLTVGVMLDL